MPLQNPFLGRVASQGTAQNPLLGAAGDVQGSHDIAIARANGSPDPFAPYLSRRPSQRNALAAYNHALDEGVLADSDSDVPAIARQPRPQYVRPPQPRPLRSANNGGLTSDVARQSATSQHHTRARTGVTSGASTASHVGGANSSVNINGQSHLKTTTGANMHVQGGYSTEIVRRQADGSYLLGGSGAGYGDLSTLLPSMTEEETAEQAKKDEDDEVASLAKKYFVSGSQLEGRSNKKVHTDELNQEMMLGLRNLVADKLEGERWLFEATSNL